MRWLWSRECRACGCHAEPFHGPRLAHCGLFVLIALLQVAPVFALASETLVYDLKGNITSLQGDNGTTSFQYDNLNRLTSEQGPFANQGFTYDANGNRLTDGASSYTYAPNSNVMATDSGLTVVHDAAGNMTTNGRGLTFEYNQAGRLKRVYDGGTLVATYAYNAFGQRTRKVTPSSTTVYHYDLDGQLLEETLANGTRQVAYVSRDNTPTAVIYAPGTVSNSGSQERLVYLHTDHLSTPRSATDDNATQVWRWESDAFGSTIAMDDPDGDDSPSVVNLRFPGQYFDEASGLLYNRFRYYDSNSGRYTGADPLGLIDGLNQYAYVANNPVRSFDRLGLSKSSTVSSLLDWGPCAAGGLFGTVTGEEPKSNGIILSPFGYEGCARLAVAVNKIIQVFTPSDEAEKNPLRGFPALSLDECDMQMLEAWKLFLETEIAKERASLKLGESYLGPRQDFANALIKIHDAINRCKSSALKICTENHPADKK